MERTRLESARGVVYGRRGRGAPVVLLHGWCLSRRLWMYQEAVLAETALVLSPDLPGFGESADLSGPYDLGRYALELGEFLSELQLTNCIVVGFAFGAAVAMTLAARDPSRLGQLVLIGVPSARHAPYDRMPRSMLRDWPDFARRSARAICKQPLSEASLDWLENLFAATPLPVALETVAELGRFDPTAVAPDVRVATLFVHGALDDVVPVSVSHACAAHMPDARVEVVPQSGHLVLLDQKERLTELLLELIASRTAALS